jgi:anti-sigma regulatory factor (Ser/Thr protein kinase)
MSHHPSRLELPLRPHPSSAARARAAAESWGATHAPARERALVLIVSELVANAVRHGPGLPVILHLELRDGEVHGEVVDQGTDPEEVGLRDDPGEDGGFGLRIVDRLARRWGVREGSTHVWFVL